MALITGLSIRFQPGLVLMTPGVGELIERGLLDPACYLQRHLMGDWGDVDEEDWESNDIGVREGDRLLSAYQVTPTDKIWIITEWDRSVTTLLLPCEY